jgi:superfamily II DNA or RNA helicase
VLLPGGIVPNDGSRDGSVAVDTVFHDKSLELLRSLGVVDAPTDGIDVSGARAFREYLQGARETYRARLPLGHRRPDETYLGFGSRPGSAWGPLDPLRLLSEEGKIRFVERCPDAAFADTWVMEHKSQPSAYPKVSFHPPLHSVVSRYGLVRTSLGPRRLPLAVGRGLTEWGALIPVADCDDAVAKRFGMAMSLQELSADQWNEGLRRAENSTDLILLGRFYERACLAVAAPQAIRCVAGTAWTLLPPSKVAVVHSESAAALLREAGEPVLLVSEARGRTDLAERWGLQVTEVGLGFVAAAPETVFVDVLPAVGRFVSPREARARIQPCETLWLEFAGANGAIRKAVPFARQEDILFAMVDLSDADLLGHVLEALGRALTDQERAAVLADAQLDRTHADLARIRQRDGLAARLLEAVGESGLRRRLPVPVVAAVEPTGTTLPGLKLAELALAVFGVDVLKQYVEELAAAGLRPPDRWSASAQARAFVEDLGFPPEYAGFEQPRLSPMLDVDGPVALKRLHDFQEEIAERIRHAVTEDPPRRGLVSLPTGAGKTRVAVEALIRAVRDRESKGCVVWVAQSEELCEQAVQAWREAWAALGPPRRLRLSRLWGQTNNRIVAAPGITHVVVATFQSLASRIERPDYGWLRDAACVVVDEAHGSITPSYTRILEQFGLTSRETQRPLIGLTATPFRGAADVEETERLAARYHRHRFDHGVIEGDDPYPLLQQRRVLAMVQHKLLPGVRFQLTEQELSELRKFNRLPASAEQRIGEFPSRNDSIVGSVLQHPSDWPVLLFAASVDHASVLACLLSANGVSARAISGQTDRGARRHYIAEFKAGRLRALTNYGVLTTGFDAPAVRALYITRPVFSRVLYQQMIGRGLRGPRNGGKEQCLIVNVEDNFSQYGEQLAFRHFEYLWTGDTRAASGT